MTLDPVPTRKDPQLHWSPLCPHLSGLSVSAVCLLWAEFLGVLQEGTGSPSAPGTCSFMECFRRGLLPSFSVIGIDSNLHAC